MTTSTERRVIVPMTRLKRIQYPQPNNYRLTEDKARAEAMSRHPAGRNRRSNE